MPESSKHHSQTFLKKMTKKLMTIGRSCGTLNTPLAGKYPVT